MRSTTTDLQEGQPESLASNLAGLGSFLIDPKAASRRLFTKWFWLIPLVVFILVSAIGNVIVTPIVQHVLESQPVPAGVNPENYQRQVETGMKVQRITGLAFPVITVTIQALVLWGMASVVAIDAKYRQMLNLAAGCSLIQALAAVAGVVILKAKGEISTLAELRPALGLDIFLPEGANKILMAILGYFSIFEVWWIVIIVLVLSAAYRIGKGKAFTVVAPLILISLVFRIVIASFQKT